MYTDDKNAQIILSLLKQYGIKKIVASPGTTNVPIVRSAEKDEWFEVYSVVDERSAAYVATGLSHATNEPVVISCTGATASRNYMSALTEAYYRKLPIIALTSQHHTSDFDNLVPQVTDRTVSQNDIKKISVELPVVKDEEDAERCILSANKALIAATTRGNGPVHINLHTVGNYSFTTSLLPISRKVDYYDADSVAAKLDELGTYLESKKVGIFIGSHRDFSDTETLAIEKFADKFNAPIYIDHTSGYKGRFSILLSQIADLKWSTNRPDVIIDLGSICGDYATIWLNGIETWRLSEDGKIHDRFHSQTLLYDGRERDFFEVLSGYQLKNTRNNYFEDIKQEVSTIVVPAEELLLSNTYVSYLLSRHIPKNTNLHMGILNSLRNMNLYELDPSIKTSSNVGGFGIDGALSTAVGISLADKNVLTFCLVGDLAAFYDMNALGIRETGSNLRILMVNNDGGVEFRLNDTLEAQWSDESQKYISAGGHNGSIKAWAESMGFKYMSAVTKEELDEKIIQFTKENIDEKVILEVFTTIPDEQNSYKLIQNVNRVNLNAENVNSEPKVISVKSRLKRVAPDSIKRIYRSIKHRE